MKATFTKLIKSIKQSNEDFMNMSKAQKRVAIAQDCINRMAVKQFSATQSYFIRGLSNAFRGVDVQRVMNRVPRINCRVCAKGGLFLSYIGRVNKFTGDDFDVTTELDSNEMKKLMQIFSARQLTMIETAFEKRYVTGIPLTFDLEMKCINFGTQYRSPDDRLIAICQNIIDNNGTFKV